MQIFKVQDGVEVLAGVALDQDVTPTESGYLLGRALLNSGMVQDGTIAQLSDTFWAFRLEGMPGVVYRLTSWAAGFTKDSQIVLEKAVLERI